MSERLWRVARAFPFALGWCMGKLVRGVSLVHDTLVVLWYAMEDGYEAGMRGKS